MNNTSNPLHPSSNLPELGEGPWYVTISDDKDLVYIHPEKDINFDNPHVAFEGMEALVAMVATQVRLNPFSLSDLYDLGFMGYHIPKRGEYTVRKTFTIAVTASAEENGIYTVKDILERSLDQAVEKAVDSDLFTNDIEVDLESEDLLDADIHCRIIW